VSVVSATCYELLGVPVHASRSEVAQAWSERRLDLNKQADRFAPEQTEALCARLDEAFAILSDPQQNKRYRAYVAQSRGDAPPLSPNDLLHPIVAEWSAKSTAIPALAIPSPDDEVADTISSEMPSLPAGPPPWRSKPSPSGPSVQSLVEDVVAALTEDAGEVEPPVVIDQPLGDLVADFDEWGEEVDDRERARTVPMGPAAAMRPKADLSSLTRLTGRRPITAMPPVRTMPATSLPKKPWPADE